MENNEENILNDLLSEIEPSFDRQFFYFPCSVELINYEIIDCVYFVDKINFFKKWGDDPKRKFIELSHVSKIFKSKFRAPKYVCEKIYALGDYWGGHFFDLVMADGGKFSYGLGSAVDFFELPSGYSFENILKIERIGYKKDKEYLRGKEYYWCLVENLESKLKAHK